MLVCVRIPHWMTCNGGATSPPIGLRHSQYPRHYDRAKGAELSGNFRYSVTATPAGHHDESKPGYILASTIAMTTNTPIRQCERLHPV